jgi:hypothetical protein
VEKRTIAKKDGRYLIYYTFRDGADSGNGKCVPAPAPERAEEEVIQSHVGTEMEPAARGVGRDRNS